jgi:carbamoyltransferase
MKPIYILGLNFAYHELSACILKDGELITAAEEERFTRIKRGKKALVDNPNMLPEKAIMHCLETAEITFQDVDYIGLSFMPVERLKNIHADNWYEAGNWGSEKGEKLFYQKITTIPHLLSNLAQYDISEKVIWIPHHICHASSSFFVSPFKKSAILSIDGIGEYSTTWMGCGTGNQIEMIKEINYPNSIGFLWEKFSMYLGFTEYDSSKMMGLAAYGKPNNYYKHLAQIVRLEEDGEFTIDNDIMRFRANDFEPLEKLFGIKKIDSPEELQKEHHDVAAALQKITDDIILHLCKYLKKKTNSTNICLAGGVALNCISNGHLMESGLFKSLYVQPAANDAGTALGAAFNIWNQILRKERSFVMKSIYWGCHYSDTHILDVLKKSGVNYKKVENISKVAAKIISEGYIIGWFQGKMEWGPRALGNRSLLADPRSADMKRIMNECVKKRESFRPFAPSILKEMANEWFDVPSACNSISTEFMTINFKVRKGKEKKIPAVIHEDGTSRVQVVNRENNELYYDLIKNFHALTGVPLVLNTSFNDNEPIVCSPDDAISTFLHTRMDFLAIGNYLVSKSA